MIQHMDNINVENTTRSLQDIGNQCTHNDDHRTKLLRAAKKDRAISLSTSAMNDIDNNKDNIKKVDLVVVDNASLPTIIDDSRKMKKRMSSKRRSQEFSEAVADGVSAFKNVEEMRMLLQWTKQKSTKEEVKDWNCQDDFNNSMGLDFNFLDDIEQFKEFDESSSDIYQSFNNSDSFLSYKKEKKQRNGINTKCNNLHHSFSTLNTISVKQISTNKDSSKQTQDRKDKKKEGDAMNNFTGNADTFLPKSTNKDKRQESKKNKRRSKKEGKSESKKDRNRDSIKERKRDNKKERRRESRTESKKEEKNQNDKEKNEKKKDSSIKKKKSKRSGKGKHDSASSLTVIICPEITWQRVIAKVEKKLDIESQETNNKGGNDITKAESADDKKSNVLKIEECDNNLPLNDDTKLNEESKDSDQNEAAENCDEQKTPDTNRSNKNECLKPPVDYKEYFNIKGCNKKAVDKTDGLNSKKCIENSADEDKCSNQTNEKVHKTNGTEGSDDSTDEQINNDNDECLDDNAECKNEQNEVLNEKINMKPQVHTIVPYVVEYESATEKQFDDGVYDAMNWLQNGNNGVNSIYEVLNTELAEYNKCRNIISQGLGELLCSNRNLHNVYRSTDIQSLKSFRRVANLPMPRPKGGQISPEDMEESLICALLDSLQDKGPSWIMLAMDNDTIEAFCKISGKPIPEYDLSQDTRSKATSQALDILLDNSFRADKLDDEVISGLADLAGIKRTKGKLKQRLSTILMPRKKIENKRKKKLLKEIFLWLRKNNDRLLFLGVDDTSLRALSKAAGLTAPRGRLKDESCKVAVTKDVLQLLKDRRGLQFNNIDQSDWKALWKVTGKSMPKVVLTSDEKARAMEQAIIILRRNAQEEDGSEKCRVAKDGNDKDDDSNDYSPLEIVDSLLPSKLTCGDDLEIIITWLRNNGISVSTTGNRTDKLNSSINDIMGTSSSSLPLLSKNPSQDMRCYAMDMALQWLWNLDKSLDYATNFEIIMKNLPAGMPIPPGTLGDKAGILEAALYWFANPPPQDELNEQYEDWGCSDSS